MPAPVVTLAGLAHALTAPAAAARVCRDRALDRFHAGPAPWLTTSSSGTSAAASCCPPTRRPPRHPRFAAVSCRRSSCSRCASIAATPAEPVVAVGERVLKGQSLPAAPAALSAAVHAGELGLGARDRGAARARRQRRATVAVHRHRDRRPRRARAHDATPAWPANGRSAARGACAPAASSASAAPSIRRPTSSRRPYRARH